MDFLIQMFGFLYIFSFFSIILYLINLQQVANSKRLNKVIEEEEKIKQACKMLY